jgi:hypothetical protein
MISATLTYTWGCLVLSPFFAASCAGQLTIVPDSIKKGHAVITTTNSAALHARFRVFVTVTSQDTLRADTAYMYVNAVGQGVPTILVSSVEKYDTYKFNSDASIKLQGIIGPPLLNTSRVVWSIDDPFLPLSRLARTQIAYHYSNTTSLYTQYFSLFGRSLHIQSGLDRKFVFTLACQSIAFSETGVAVAKVTVSVNAPPMTGTLTISPPVGQAFRTKYTFLSSNWVDSDFPLLYEFLLRGSYVRHGGLVTTVGNNYLQLQGREGNAMLDAQLPAGLSGDNDVLYVAVTVYDTFSAAAFLESQVSVSPGNSSDLSMLYDKLPKAYKMRSDERRVVLTTASVSLNRYNCTLAPPSLCTSLKREPCIVNTPSYSNVCGACLVGYFGDDGPHMTLCNLTPDATIEYTDDFFVTEVLCVTQFQCDLAGGGRKCIDGKCVLRSKICPNDCNQHGTCRFVNRYTLAQVEECYVSDPTCIAQCICFREYAGIGCRSSVEDIIGMQTQRYILLQAIHFAALEQENNVESVVEIARRLMEALSAVDEISNYAGMCVLCDSCVWCMCVSWCLAQGGTNLLW